MLRNRSSRDDPPQEDFPLVTSIQTRTSVARLRHQCTVCGQPINPGDRYKRELLRDDDALNARKALIVAKYHDPYFLCDTPEPQEQWP